MRDAQLGRGLVHLKVGRRGEVLKLLLALSLVVVATLRLLFGFTVLQLKEKSIARFKIRSWGCVAVDRHDEGLWLLDDVGLCLWGSGHRELGAALVLEIVQ